LPNPVTGFFIVARKMPGTAAISRLRRTALPLRHRRNSRRRAVFLRLSSAISASVALSLWVGEADGLTGGSKSTLPLLRDL
jgi:hypothetical protein